MPDYLRNSGRWLVAAGLMLYMCGCATDRAVRHGLALQEKGAYLEAYRYFDRLVQRHPRHEEFRTCRDTARGLAFRQAVGRAESALGRNDLDGFLAHMKAAGEIQPGDRVRLVCAIVENARAAGKSDTAIRDELRAAMRQAGVAGPLEETLAGVAERIAAQAQQGLLRAPLSVVDFTLGNATGLAVAAYFEDALAGALVKTGLAVVERKDLQRVLNEIQLSRAGMIEDRHAVEAGKLTGALSVLTGSIYAGETEMRYQARVLDVETGRIVFQESGSFRPDQAMQRMMRAVPY